MPRATSVAGRVFGSLAVIGSVVALAFVFPWLLLIIPAVAIGLCALGITIGAAKK